MKALCVFSGGLDSMLATQVVRAQGVEVLPVFFETPFFESSRAAGSAEALGLPLRIVDVTERHFELVKTPRHGHGANMNPCIDCHALMVRVAGEMLASENADFVITGEVLGQRPMSQTRRGLSLVVSESGIGGLLVRPLSAKLLPPTIPEQQGWLSRERLCDIEGRSRKSQMELAGRFSITRYPRPGGGCLLTEKGFSRRLKDLLETTPGPMKKDLLMLKLGRHFRLGKGVRLIVGRNKRENDELASLASGEDTLLDASGIPGPMAVLSGPASPGDMETALAITLAYSDSQELEKWPVTIWREGVRKEVVTPVADKKLFSGLLV